MQGFLNRINKTVEILWDEYSKKYPGFFFKDQNNRKNMPKIIAAQTMLNLPDFPLYAKRYIDQDPTSWYFFMGASPLAGKCDRDTAVELFHDIFHNQLGMKSSFEDEGYDDKTAADMEVLPAENDKNYKTYFEQQMEELAKAMGVMPDEEAEKKAADDEFEKKFGFRRDDPDIIDVEVDDPGAPKAEQKPGLQKAEKFAVGAPKRIFYCVDLHVPANYELGYDKNKGALDNIRNRRNRLGGPNGGVRRLREDEMDEMLQEAVDSASVAAKLDELIAMVEPGSGLQIALLDIKDKFALSECDACGDPECKDGEICGLKEDEKLDEAYLSQEDRDEIADMFAGYGSGTGSSLGVSRQALDGFMTAHAAELQQLRRGQASGLGDFNAARDLGSDDEQCESEDDIEKEIAGIVNEGDEPDEEVSETEKLIKEYGEVEDDVEEDEDELSESVIRHANMLSREIW
jgi:hypothetical protein